MNQPLQTPREGKHARRKVTTDLGRQIMQRERQRLAREQAALGEQLAAEAKRQMAQKQVNKKRVQPEQIAVGRSIIKRISAVLGSENVNAPIHARPTKDQVSAWTDFDQIVLNYEMHDDVRLLAATLRGLAYHEGGHCRFTIPFRQLVEMALGAWDSSTAKYHKAWNILEDQRMETAVVSDSPRKAAYFTPMVMTELTPTVNAAAANWPILVWRKYLPAKIRKGARKLFVAKHMLMGQDGEQLAKRWEAVVTSYVMADNAPDMWAAVLVAHDLLQETQPVPAATSDMGHDNQYNERKDASDLDDALVIPIDPSMLPEGDMIDIDGDEPVIDTTDPEVAEHLGKIIVAILSHPESLLRIVYGVPTPAQPSNEQGAGSPSPTPSAEDEGDEGESEESEDGGDSQPGSDADRDDEGDDEEADEDDGELTDAHGEEDDTDSGRSQQDADDDGDEDRDDDGDDDEGAGADAFDDADEDDEADEDADEEDAPVHVDPADENGEGAGRDGSHDPDKVATEDDDDDEELTDEELQSALDEAEAERDADAALDGDVHAFQEAVDSRVSDLLPYQTTPSSDYEAAAAAHNLADELERSFQQATMDKQPMWVEQQRRGVLNVMRYKTRQPGETEFFRQWTEDDAPGYDMAVSIYLDYSGSMASFTTELAQCGYASKLACEKLDIPCTVVLWDTDAMVLWDANEQAEALPVIQAAGGTDPQTALADLANQRYGKTQHVVVIMTDGEWNGHQNTPGFLAAYKEEGRILIGAGFNSGYGSAEHIADKLRRYGCDESYACKSLMEIPHLLEQTLVALV